MIVATNIMAESVVAKNDIVEKSVASLITAESQQANNVMESSFSIMASNNREAFWTPCPFIDRDRSSGASSSGCDWVKLDMHEIV